MLDWRWKLALLANDSSFQSDRADEKTGSETEYRLLKTVSIKHGKGYPPCSSPIIGKLLHGVLIELLHAHPMPYTMHHKTLIPHFISWRVHTWHAWHDIPPSSDSFKWRLHLPRQRSGWHGRCTSKPLTLQVPSWTIPHPFKFEI